MYKPLSRSNSPLQQAGSAGGAPVPVAESLPHFLLVLLHGSGSAGLPPSSDTALSSSAVVRTLNLLCSWRSTGAAGVVLLVQEVISSQPSSLKESPFASLISTDSACPFFGTTVCSGSCLDMTQLCSFLIDLRLCSLLTFSCWSFTWQQRSSNSTQPLWAKAPSPHPGLSKAPVPCTAFSPTPGDLHPPMAVPCRSRSGAVGAQVSGCSGLWPVAHHHRCWAHMHGSQQSSCLLRHKLQTAGPLGSSVSCTCWIKVLKEHHTDSKTTYSVKGKDNFKLVVLVKHWQDWLVFSSLLSLPPLCHPHFIFLPFIFHPLHSSNTRRIRSAPPVWWYNIIGPWGKNCWWLPRVSYSFFTSVPFLQYLPKCWFRCLFFPIASVLPCDQFC